MKPSRLKEMDYWRRCPLRKLLVLLLSLDWLEVDDVGRVRPEWEGDLNLDSVLVVECETKPYYKLILKLVAGWAACVDELPHTVDECLWDDELVLERVE